MRPRLQSLPLRILLIAPFALQMTATMGAIGYLSWRNEQQLLESFARHWIDEHRSQVNHSLATTVSSPLASPPPKKQSQPLTPPPRDVPLNAGLQPLQSQAFPNKQSNPQDKTQDKTQGQIQHPLLSHFFVTERSGKLISLGGSPPLVYPQGQTIEHRLGTAIAPSIPQPPQSFAQPFAPQFAQQFTQQLETHLQSHQQSLHSLKQDQFLTLSFGGQRHYVQVYPWENQQRLDWLVVMVVPESNFLHHLRHYWLVTMALGVGAIGGAIGLGLWMLRCISQPLEKSIQAAKSLAQGQWQLQLPPSQVREFTQLGQAFQQMATQLHDAFTHLEHHAFHDTLTGLLNEDAFRQEIALFIQRYHGPSAPEDSAPQSSVLLSPKPCCEGSSAAACPADLASASPSPRSPQASLQPIYSGQCCPPGTETPAKSEILQGFAVLFLDLDDFKLINDSFGHLVGDQVLIAVADRLRKVLTPNDRLARFGGDAFMVLMAWCGTSDAIPMDVNFPPSTGQGGLYLEPQGTDMEVLEQRAQVLVDLFQEPFYLQGQEIFVSASIGVMPWNQGGRNPENFFQGADIALSQAKGKGKGGYQIFTPMMQAAAIERLRLETELRLALERNELRVYYQPILNAQTRELVGFEALVRWHHPVYGLVAPGVFIPTAEESGLIVPLGWWVMRAACWQMKQWQEQFRGARPLFMSINVSSKQMLQGNCVDMMETIVAETGLSLDHLKLEITESGLIEMSGPVRDCLNYLEKRNFQFSIDDFGTGYAGFSYLQHLPVNTLKIDRSFVKDIDQSPKNWHIVSTIVSLVHQIGLTVVAEGVETESQLQTLQGLGCDLVQGYLFSAPVPGSVIEEIFFTHAMV